MSGEPAKALVDAIIEATAKDLDNKIMAGYQEYAERLKEFGRIFLLEKEKAPE